jgi:hypothetical protein
MTRVLDAIAWSGSGISLSLFAVFPVLPPPSWDPNVGSASPRVRMLVLDDDARVLPSGAVVEYDLGFAGVPSDLANYLRECLKRVLRAGARVAWFGFEGSFDCEHVLTEDIADQIYAVGTATGQLWLALDDATILSPEWRESLALLRSQLR